MLLCPFSGTSAPITIHVKNHRKVTKILQAAVYSPVAKVQEAECEEKEDMYVLAELYDASHYKCIHSATFEHGKDLFGPARHVSGYFLCVV
jgi:hypothetical protein